MSRIRVQQNAGKSSRQALRSRPVPEEIRKAIELENHVPPDQTIPTFNEFFHAILREQRSVAEREHNKKQQDLERGGKPSYENSAEDWRLEAHQTVIQKLPESLQEFIGPITHETIDEAYGKVYFFSQTIDLIRKIADLNRANDGSPFSYSIETTLILKTDDKGRFINSPPPLLEALEGVEVARIRACQFCGKVFWAGRIDQSCCSHQCAGNLRARRWRERYEEKYKEQRYKKNEKEDLERQEAKKGRK